MADGEKNHRCMLATFWEPPLSEPALAAIVPDEDIAWLEQ
jgi:hypothetical protein